jgi:hypothetical protein
MPIFLRIPIALDLILVGIQHTVPATGAFLPLGGDPFIQFAALMCVGLGVQEMFGHK